MKAQQEDQEVKEAGYLTLGPDGKTIKKGKAKVLIEGGCIHKVYMDGEVYDFKCE